MNDLKRELSPLAGALENASQRVLASGWFVLGPELEAFEAEWSDYLGGGHTAGLGNGTDALELALRALGIGPRDTVATVANAGGYATTAIRAIGADVQYLEIGEQTALLDPAALPRPPAPMPAALIVTHLYGSAAPMAQIMEWSQAFDVPVVEDCAQAHGARIDGRHVGTFGSAGCFSFYPTKNLGALGDAGAVFARERQLVDRVRSLRQYGWESKYEVRQQGGRNSRLDELQAACLRVRLDALDQSNRARRDVARRYLECIDNPAIEQPARALDETDVFHLFTVRCGERDALARHLADHDIASAIHYPRPDHLQPAWQGDRPAPGLERSERHARQTLSLPCHPALSPEETDHVIDVCNRFAP